MKVLHILQSNRISGAENVVGDICMMFDSDFEMAYCSPEGPIRKALSARGVSFFPLETLNFKEVRRAINTFKPDIIHAHDVRATVLATCASRNIPIISHLHGNMEDMRKIGVKSILYMLATKNVKKVITVSKGCLDEYIFRDKIKHKTILLQNIIYKKRIQKLIKMDTKDYDFDFVYIGRLTYQKNPERIAEIASRVLKICSNANFGVIGNGELIHAMKSVFEKYGVENRVTFTGSLDYPYKALSQAKCLLMCSRFEGTPIAALESMLLGVPIVSTPVDGMKELVKDGVTGYLSEEDNILVERVKELISSKEQFKKLSDSSIEYVSSFIDEDIYINTLKEIYEEILNYDN